MTIYGLMVSKRLGSENISREILERVEPPEHRPERQGGEDGDPQDRAQAGEGA
jgi:hypothetical protein